MNDAIARMAPRLKTAGFTKKAGTFNRNLPNGITHVVQFWSGSYLSGYNGQFIVLFGLTVRDDQSPFLTEVHCRMRGRIGDLLDQPADTWWQVDDPDTAVAELEPLFERMLAYFDEHVTIEQILARAEGPDQRVPPHWEDDPFFAAELSLRQGDRARAQKNFSRTVASMISLAPLDMYVKFAEENDLELPKWVGSPRGRARMGRKFSRRRHDAPYVPWRG